MIMAYTWSKVFPEIHAITLFQFSVYFDKKKFSVYWPIMPIISNESYLWLPSLSLFFSHSLFKIKGTPYGKRVDHTNGHTNALTEYCNKGKGKGKWIL